MSKRLVHKVVIVGDQKVGKTSIRRAFFGEQFHSSYIATLGADFAIKRVTIDENTVQELNIWDLAGQSTFYNVRKHFFKGASLTLLVFDLTEKETFISLTNWCKQLWDATKRYTTPLFLIGNKTDLKKQVVTDQEVEKYIIALRNAFDLEGLTIEYFKTSAKTNENIDNCCDLISSTLVKEIGIKS